MSSAADVVLRVGVPGVLTLFRLFEGRLRVKPSIQQKLVQITKGQGKTK